MEEYKKNWTEKDFEIMSWHDCRLYGIAFHREEFSLQLDIDYIFEWKLNEDETMYDRFLVAPAILTFSDYDNLEINIPWGQTYDVIINEIKKGESKPGSSNKLNVNEYQIILETGYINLSARGYNMILKTDPIITNTQDFGFEKRKILISKFDD